MRIISHKNDLPIQEKYDKLREMAHQYCGEMLALARYYVGRQSDLAEDIVQETWLRILQYPKKLLELPPDIPPDERGRYIRMVLRNEIARTCNKYHHPLEDSEEDMSHHLGTYNTAEEAIERVMADTVNDLIKQLPNQYLAVVFLRVHHDMGTKDIAKVLGVSDDVVRKRLSRFRAALVRNGICDCTALLDAPSKKKNRLGKKSRSD